MRPTHPAGVVGVRKAAFDPFTSAAQQPLATLAADAATIAVDRGACLFLIDPRLRATVGLTDVGPEAVCIELEDHRTTVAAFVGHDLVGHGDRLAVPVGHLIELL